MIGRRACNWVSASFKSWARRRRGAHVHLRSIPVRQSDGELSYDLSGVFVDVSVGGVPMILGVQERRASGEVLVHIHGLSCRPQTFLPVTVRTAVDSDAQVAVWSPTERK